MAAAKAMSAADWKSARDLICDIKIWDLLPNTTQIKEMLQRLAL